MFNQDINDKLEEVTANDRKEISIYEPQENELEKVTAYHSGDMGDIVYAIPLIKLLKVEKIYLNPSFNMNFPEGLRPKMGLKGCELIKPLLESQGWEVEINSNPPVAVNYMLDKYRFKETYKKNDPYTTHLALWQATAFDLQDDVTDAIKEPFLSVEPNPVADIVINRSPRYHNNNFTWYELLRGLKCNIIFVGLKSEYDNFLNITHLTNVQYYPVENLYEAARIIAGAKVFIGNQSVGYAIAEGLKINRIQETCQFCPNVKSLSENGIEVNTRGDLLNAKIKLYEWLGMEVNFSRELPDKVLLYCTAYMYNDYSFKRVVDWIRYYKKNMQKLGATHIALIDDCSHPVWLEKLKLLFPEIAVQQIRIRQQNNTKVIEVPPSEQFLEGNIHYLSFPTHLGRPNLFLFPGWWRSFSFGSVLAQLYGFDKFIFIESDMYLFTDKIFDFIRNSNEGYNSAWSPISEYREAMVQWCDKSNFHKVAKYFSIRGQMQEQFWWAVNLHTFQYLPKHVLPFTNDLTPMYQFKLDRYGDDHYPNGIPPDADGAGNLTDISLNKIFHRQENLKNKQLNEILNKIGKEEKQEIQELIESE